MSRPPLKVFLTVDTEFYPRTRRPNCPDWQAAVERDVYGSTPEGEFGLRFLVERFAEHDLKAVFFVESLFASVLGPTPLAEITETVRAGGHETQLHLHTGWLAVLEGHARNKQQGHNISDFSEDEQVELIDTARRNLQMSGVSEVRAFRAGNFGANFSTLHALARLGIPFDTSYDVPYLGKTCSLATDHLLLQPEELCGVTEFPVGFFNAFPTGYRRLQLAACSFWEFKTALFSAWKRRWYGLVIVLHSFELLKRGRRGERRPAVDRVVMRRFTRLCQFLSGHRDQFKTIGFADVAKSDLAAGHEGSVIRSGPLKTLCRIGEQAFRRVL